LLAPIDRSRSIPPGRRIDDLTIHFYSPLLPSLAQQVVLCIDMKKGCPVRLLHIAAEVGAWTFRLTGGAVAVSEHQSSR
jgi:hypothetical protein